jgi:hypothetical protein
VFCLLPPALISFVAMRKALVVCLFAAGWPVYAASELPVRGLHLRAVKPQEVPAAVRFISEELPKHRINVLVFEVGYRYQFTRRPEMADPNGLSRADLEQISAACRKAGVRLIPLMDLMGHQSWGKTVNALLRVHPEFEEAPSVDPGQCCRSYCPLHPKIHEVIFDLVDEVAEACGADALHAGLDEVVILGTDQCPRCRGKNKAELYAQEVRAIHDHLGAAKRQMWMWGDRFLDAETLGTGPWEASANGTHAALQKIPKDIVICDWHYNKAHPTPAWFAVEGFPVVASPWHKASVALAQLELIRNVRANASEAVANRMLGVLQTNWTSFESFLKAYNGDATAEKEAIGAVESLRSLFGALKQ